MYTIKSTDLDKISLNEPDEVKSVLQNIGVMLNTWQGDNPLFRDFGLPREARHKPVSVARQLIKAGIIECAAKYEPRAKISKVSFESDAPDSLIITVNMEIEL